MLKRRELLLNKWLWMGAGGLLVLIFLVMQFVPIAKENPPVIQEPDWDSPRTRELAVRACYDCHSNEANFPWYADVAPMRIMVRQNVIEGREKLNFSEMNRRYELDELGEVIREGEMPPWDYLLLHSDARLSDSEKDELVAGFRATFGGVSGGEGHDDDDDDD